LKLTISNWAGKLFCLFVITDISFIILHIVYLASNFSISDAFSIEKDRGYAEIFQYLKTYWSALLLVYCAFQRRSLHYLSWALLFFYLQLKIPDMFNLRGGDFGEIAISASAALLLLGMIGIAYRFGDRLFRQFSKYFIAMLFALAFFGIVVDLLHTAVQGSALQPFLELLEDGGEMIVISIMACCALILSERLQASHQELGNSELSMAASISRTPEV
jgi:hypothetical protein